MKPKKPIPERRMLQLMRSVRRRVFAWAACNLTRCKYVSGEQTYSGHVHPAAFIPYTILLDNLKISSRPLLWEFG